MFGNRGYRWKLGAGLAAIALLGISTGIRGESLNPSVWRCLADPQGADGARLWVPSAVITAVHDRDFEILAEVVRIRVTGPAPAPAGSRISLRAVFHGASPALEPLQIRILPAGNLGRRLMEIVSVIVTLGVLANFTRHFLFRPRVLQVERGGP